VRILLLSEAPMCVNAGGISQTLYNIFDFCQPEDMLCIAPAKDVQDYQPTAPFEHCYLTYEHEWLRLPSNRITHLFRPLINWINFSVLKRSRHKALKQKIAAFKPDVVVSCPNGVSGVIMHETLLKDIQAPVFPYFMDDWMYNKQQHYAGGNLQSAVKQVLASNSKWMMIGNELAEVLSERYHQIPTEVLPIRNPVDLSTTPQVKPFAEKDVYTYAYAGALWPMHFDAFLAVAKAVALINRQQRRINLVVYTAEHFWNWRKPELAPLGVQYGGNIPYNKIHQVLSEADACILVSSFSQELYTHAKASVQTKITDYLKAQRLIISCGPDYSANHNFLRQYDCGVCIESNDVQVVSKQLKDITDELPAHQQKVQNGFQILQTEFAKPVVQQRLRRFLGEKLS